MKKDITALIPVKKTSDRIKDKNIRRFSDTSLFELKLKQISSLSCFDRLIVSTEDSELMKIAESYGFQIHNRDKKYSTSEIPMSDVYKYIASEIDGEHIAWINVTNPLAYGYIYENAVSDYLAMEESYDCLLSVVELKDYIFFNGKPLNFKPNPWPRSQDLEGTLAMSYVINILRREDMIKWGSCVGFSPYFYTLDQTISTDIDFQIDFEFCEFIYNKRKKNI